MNLRGRSVLLFLFVVFTVAAAHKHHNAPKEQLVQTYQNRNMITIRKSADRGDADHGWLKSKHTFTFADYYDQKFMSYGSLRVINEDHVSPGQGFPTHPHRDFEIFSYVVEGAIEHKDSMGNTEVCEKGDIQFTSAGSGVYHSEFSVAAYGNLYFLQIWVRPNKQSLPPAYSTKHFSDEQKTNKLCLCLSGGGEPGVIHINQDIKVYASLLENNHVIDYTVAPGRKLYLHSVETGGNLNIKSDAEGQEVVTLQGGDGAFISTNQKITLTGSDEAKPSHFLLFDLVDE